MFASVCLALSMLFSLVEKGIGADLVGESVLAGGSEASFELLVPIFPPFKYPREIVGVPDHPRDAGLDYLGRLQFVEDSFPLDKVNTTSRRSAWVEIGNPPELIASDSNPFKRRLMADCLPIYILTCGKKGVEYEQTVFGFSANYSPDAEPFILVRVQFRSASEKLPETAALAVGAEGDHYDWPVHVTGPETAEVDLKIPYNNPRSAVSIQPQEFEKLLAATTQFWKKTLASGNPFNVPEPRVNDALKMWRAYSLLMTDKINGYLEPHDGAGVYDLIYGYSAAKHIMMLDHFGEHHRAEEMIDTLLQFQHPDGLYTQNFGLPDEGTLMEAIVEHYRLTGDAGWLRSKAKYLIAEGEWIIKMRSRAPTSGVIKGLIKWRPYCDYPTETYNYFGNITSCIGLEKATAALREIGYSDAARRFEEAGIRYRRDLHDSMESAAFEQDGFTILPLEPDTHRVWNESGKKATDYYGLSASTLLETDFFQPDDEPSRWICDALNRDGLCAGLTRFQGGLDHAYTYGYLRTMLRRGDSEKVILGFYSMMAFGMTRDTFSPVETTKDHRTGYNCQTLPHLYSCTVQQELLRMMLLREDNSALNIGEAIPRAWLKDGKSVTAADAPTTFGDVSFAITSHAARGEIDVKISPPRRNRPDVIRVHLRHPDKATISKVLVNGKPWSRFNGEIIELDAREKSLAVKAFYH